MAITLVFWCQQWLVGNAPFPLKSVLEVTHLSEKRQLRPISAHNVSTVGDSKISPITRIYDEYEVDHGLSNEP